MNTRHNAAVTVLLAAAVVPVAQADTIYVDANCPGGDGSELDPYCSIQTAIDNAADTEKIAPAAMRPLLPMYPMGGAR